MQAEDADAEELSIYDALGMSGIDKFKILNANAIDALECFPDDSIDCIVTSPPYKEKDGYNRAVFRVIFGELFRVAKPGALCFVNFGHLAEDKLRPFVVANEFVHSGFEVNDTIVWAKNHFTPLQGKKRLNNLTEFIFLLFKPPMPDMDRLAIGVPYADKGNVGRYAEKDLRCAGNLWNINIPTITKKEERLHPDEFPVELPDRCLRLSGLKHGVVVDPFCGSGTTGIAANNLGLTFIGIELNPRWARIAENRLKDNKKLF